MGTFYAHSHQESVLFLVFAPYFTGGTNNFPNSFLSALPETATITQFARPDEEYEGWGLEGEESTAAEPDKKRPYEQDVGSKPSVSSDNGTQISSD
jgi:hypothetical protein